MTKKKTIKERLASPDPTRISPCAQVISDALWSDWVEGECAYDIAETTMWDFLLDRGYSTAEADRIFSDNETKYRVVEAVLRRHGRNLTRNLEG